MSLSTMPLVSLHASSIEVGFNSRQCPNCNLSKIPDSDRYVVNNVALPGSTIDSQISGVIGEIVCRDIVHKTLKNHRTYDEPEMGFLKGRNVGFRFWARVSGWRTSGCCGRMHKIPTETTSVLNAVEPMSVVRCPKSRRRSGKIGEMLLRQCLQSQSFAD